MAYPSLTFANLLDNTTRMELEQFVSLLQGYLSAQHDENGAHTDVTAESLTVTGDVTSEGNGTFDGTVTADADGGPITLGPLGPTSEPSVRLKNGTTSDWQFYAKSGRILSLRDVLEAGDAAMLDVVRTGSSAYDVRPHSSAITLKFGTDVSGQRLAEVNTAAIHVASKGAWTPAVLINGSATGITYGSNVGWYTQIDDEITLHANITLTSKGASVGAVTVSGLPVSGLTGFVSIGSAQATANNAGLVAPYCSVFQTDVFLLDTATSNAVQWADTNLTNTSQFRFTITYKV